MYLHQITRKIPPRAENVVQDKKKERDYMNFRQSTASGYEHNLLKMMVTQELDEERKELLDLAERVGYLDPARSCGNTLLLSSPALNKNSAYTPLGLNDDLDNDKTTNRLSRPSSFFGNRLKPGSVSQAITPSMNSPNIKQPTESTFCQTVSLNVLPPASALYHQPKNGMMDGKRNQHKFNATANRVSIQEITNQSLKPTPQI